MKVAKSITELIGKTPIVALSRLTETLGVNGTLLGKIESFNPAGSVKDRPALAMIRDAENSGRLRPGMTIIEATSGNTGVGLAMVGAALGYPVIAVMPETMSVERQRLIAAYGATVILTKGALGMKGATDYVAQQVASSDRYFQPNQFANPANARVHEKTTAEEIWEAMGTSLDVFVAGVGSGGTITGVARVLKERHPSLHVVLVEPSESPLLSQGQAGPHRIQGIGANFVPSLLDQSLADEILTVDDEDAITMARLLAKKEGILCGISSGAALSASAELLQQGRFQGANILAILPDTGERYLSMDVFDFAVKHANVQ